MGLIRIESAGSFGSSRREFSAISGGHADAVAQAIEYLSKEILPAAIRLDHKLAEQGSKPMLGFAVRSQDVHS